MPDVYRFQPDCSIAIDTVWLKWLHQRTRNCKHFLLFSLLELVIV